MKPWIGKSIIFIGIIHSIFGFLVFSSVIGKLFNEGLLNTVNLQPKREAVYWFMFFGFLAIILGALVDWCENKFSELPKFLGWSFLAFTICSVIIMPISGMWLFLIPSIAIILKNS